MLLGNGLLLGEEDRIHITPDSFRCQRCKGLHSHGDLGLIASLILDENSVFRVHITGQGDGCFHALAVKLHGIQIDVGDLYNLGGIVGLTVFHTGNHRINSIENCTVGTDNGNISRIIGDPCVVNKLLCVLSGDIDIGSGLPLVGLVQFLQCHGSSGFQIFHLCHTGKGVGCGDGDGYILIGEVIKHHTAQPGIPLALFHLDNAFGKGLVDLIGFRHLHRNRGSAGSEIESINDIECNGFAIGIGFFCNLKSRRIKGIQNLHQFLRLGCIDLIEGEISGNHEICTGAGGHNKAFIGPIVGVYHILHTLGGLVGAGNLGSGSIFIHAVGFRHGSAADASNHIVTLIRTGQGELADHRDGIARHEFLVPGSAAQGHIITGNSICKGSGGNIHIGIQRRIDHGTQHKEVQMLLRGHHISNDQFPYGDISTGCGLRIQSIVACIRTAKGNTGNGNFLVFTHILVCKRSSKISKIYGYSITVLHTSQITGTGNLGGSSAVIDLVSHLNTADGNFLGGDGCCCGQSLICRQGIITGGDGIGGEGHGVGICHILAVIHRAACHSNGFGIAEGICFDLCRNLRFSSCIVFLGNDGLHEFQIRRFYRIGSDFKGNGLCSLHRRFGGKGNRCLTGVDIILVADLILIRCHFHTA